MSEPKKKRPCRRRAPAGRTKKRPCLSSRDFKYPSKKIRQKKSEFEVIDECLLEAIAAGIEKNRAEEVGRPRTIFHLRTVSPLRRVWRNIKTFFRQLFHTDTLD